MTIPKYYEIHLPLLTILNDGQEHSLRDSINVLSDNFSLSSEERSQLLASGQQPVFDNRVGWAHTYLKKSGLIESTKRGFFKITQRGISVLNNPPNKIDADYLMQFKEFRDFREYTKTEQPNSSIDSVSYDPITPQEQLENAYSQIRTALASELLQQIKTAPPSLFEKIVVELLLKMGYGGSRKDAGQTVGGSGDGGIDGIINEDLLGLDVIYIQAKRWEGTVGRPEIQKFAGALLEQHAKKGVFITTSNFSKEAQESVKKVDSKIILIDGEKLTQHLIDFNIGVNASALYELKKLIRIILPKINVTLSPSPSPTSLDLGKREAYFLTTSL